MGAIRRQDVLGGVTLEYYRRPPTENHAHRLNFYNLQALIGGMNNEAPEIIYAMIKYTFDGGREKAEKTYLVMVDLCKKMHFTDATTVSHMVTYARGFNAGYPRKTMLLPYFYNPKYHEIQD